jgi:hypothetical protein
LTIVLEMCPKIGVWQATPGRVPVGGSVALTATTENADGAIFTWTSADGTFDDPHSTTTTFHCLKQGFIRIGLFISNGDCGDQDGFTMECD